MATRKAYVKQLSGITFAGRTEQTNHWVMWDGPETFGGSNAAIRPKELLLLSLAGCTASDVVAILQKKRVNFHDFEMNITAEETEEHPKVYKSINLEYVVYGTNVKAKDVERAIELSQDKYCGVTEMLRHSVEITHTYKIVDTAEEKN
jgi:putative redox protein